MNSKKHNFRHLVSSTLSLAASLAWLLKRSAWQVNQKRLLLTSLVTIGLLLSISACSVFTPQTAEARLFIAPQNRNEDTAKADLVKAINTPTPSDTKLPTTMATATTTATNTPIPSPTNTPTSMPTSTPTSTLTPTPTLHPMMIEAMRQRAYPGSQIVIEEELKRGANYNRYYAYYLSEGLKIYALLTIPDGEIPPTGWPAIVFNHGYIPPDQYRTTERYIAYVDNLARRGYVVFRIDYRGHDRSEGAATGAYGNPGYTLDVLNAVESLKQHPQVDPNRIGMWGHSMGGYLTLRSMVISPDIKAGVIWAGVVASYPDLLTRWRRSIPTPIPSESTPRRWRWSWIDEFGSPEENPEFWKAVSANSYLSDISGPIQLHHGTTDEDVPVLFSQLLEEQLVQAGKPVELYTYPNDNHNLSESFSLAMQRTIAFYDRYLK